MSKGKTLQIYTENDTLVVCNLFAKRTYRKITDASRLRLESITYNNTEFYCRALLHMNSPVVFVSQK